MATLSRQLAQWVVGLRYEDLPPAVIDRARGVAPRPRLRPAVAAAKILGFTKDQVNSTIALAKRSS